MPDNNDDVTFSGTSMQSARPGAVGARLSGLRAFLAPSGNRLIVVVSAIIWVLLTSPPSLSGFALNEVSLDASWQACNGYFLQRHSHAGIDFVFPTWVLGYFYGAAYNRSLYWFYYVWQCLLASCLSVNITRYALRFPRFSERLTVLVVSGIALTVLRADAVYFALMLLAGSLLLFTSGPQTASLQIQRSLPILFLLATLSLVKFSFLSVASIIVVLAALHSIVNYTSNPRVNAGMSLLLPLLFALIFVGMWLLFGQRLTDLPTALHNEASISIGYNDAMGATCRDITLAAGVVVFATFGLLLIKTRKCDAANSISGVTLLLFAAFVLWKLGFVRADAGHTGIFFGLILILTVLLPVYFGRHETQPLWHRRLSVVCVLICVGGIISGKGFKYQAAGWVQLPFASTPYVFAPWRVQRHLEAERTSMEEELALPRTCAIVRNAPIDVISYEQRTALFNHLNFRPRPVYQSYSAYSSYLCRLNADFYRGPQAPAYVLFKLQTIDDRLPMLDDNQTMLELLRSYHPVLIEKGYTLLAHNARASAEARMQPCVYQTHSGEGITIGDDATCHLLALRVRATAIDKIRSALLRPDRLIIEVHLTDGQKIQYHLPPKMAETNVLLDPLLQNSRDVVRLYGGAAFKRVQSFTLYSEHPAPQQTFEVTLTPVNSLVGENLPPAQAEWMSSQAK